MQRYPKFKSSAVSFVPNFPHLRRELEEPITGRRA